MAELRGLPTQGAPTTGVPAPGAGIAPAEAPAGPPAQGRRRLVVAVDGPSGSGKSTVSRGVAGRLDLDYLDTGAMYRALTWLALQRGVDPADQDATAALAAGASLQMGTDPAAPWVRIEGHDVTRAVREPAVTAAVSAVSASPGVRSRLVAQQRRLANGGADRAAGGAVVEGRDIASVVLPGADVKVFLTASGAARAARRAAEAGPGAPPTHLDQTRADLDRRDRHDSSRVASPLLRAPDALELDSTDLGVDEVVQRVLALCERALSQPAPSATAHADTEHPDHPAGRL